MVDSKPGDHLENAAKHVMVGLNPEEEIVFHLDGEVNHVKEKLWIHEHVILALAKVMLVLFCNLISISIVLSYGTKICGKIFSSLI